MDSLLEWKVKRDMLNMNEVDKNGYNKQQTKMQKALNDVENILDSYYKSGELQQEVYDRIISEVEQAFDEGTGGQKTSLEDSDRK